MYIGVLGENWELVNWSVQVGLIVDEKGSRDLASLADWGHVPMT